MRMKKPVRVAYDQVRITREGKTAIIEHADPAISTTRLTIGEKIEDMSDREILDLHNAVIASQEQLLREWDNTVTEIAPGEPQITYHDRSEQWVPEGEVLRCVIEDDADGEVIIYVDNTKLSLQEFGRMLSVYAGWGMRIAFVPEELLADQPRVKRRKRRKRRRQSR